MISNIKDLEKREVIQLLDEAKVPIDWLGYKCIVTAIPIVIDAIYCNQKITLNEIFSEVAKKHRTTARKVECALRYVHENTRIKKVLNEEKLTTKSMLFLIAKLIMKKLHIE